MMPMADGRTRIPTQNPWSDPAVRVVFGVLLLGTLWVFWYEVEPLLTFRPVDAVVVGSDVARVKVSGRKRMVDRYDPEIYFRYEVSGTRYLGMRFRRIDLEFSSSRAWQHAQAYVAGSKVRAWYNPLRPDEAVLSRAPNLPMFLFSSLVLFLSLLGALPKLWRAAPARAMSAPID